MIKTKNKNRFMSWEAYQHNKQIEFISYANKKITKPLFFIGAVLPDFKISWVILVGYLIYKYPISLKTILSNKIKDIRTDLYLLVLRRRFIR